MTVTWVIGAGGLLGSHAVRSLARAGHQVVTSEVPWRDPARASEALAAGIRQLEAAAEGERWAVAWCAGAGVVATPQAELDAEVALFRTFLDELTRLGSGGAVFLASSAGGVYAGSDGEPPFTEASPSVALAPYGRAKLAMEDLAHAYAAASGSQVLVGRIANLYGPGQNLAKAQGLVSLLCLAQLTGQPLPVFVSLDTLRDYLYVEDAAAMVVAGLDRLVEQPEPVVTKILASGRATSVAALIGDATRVFRRRPPIVLGSSPSAAVQVRDLRLASIVWPDLDRLARTPLPVGLARTRSSIAGARALPRT